MLATSVLGGALIIEHSVAHGHAGANDPSGAFPPVAYLGLTAAAWLLSAVAVTLMDLVGRLTRRSRDPYEDHPKMSPSVQPRNGGYWTSQPAAAPARRRQG